MLLYFKICPLAMLFSRYNDSRIYIATLHLKMLKTILKTDHSSFLMQIFSNLGLSLLSQHINKEH